VADSTFSQNSSSGLGGAIYNSGILTAVNSTLSGNSAESGGGLYTEPFGTVTVTNSIIAGSDRGGDCNSGGRIVDGDHNLIQSAASACGLTNGVNGNIIGVDPMLDPAGLQDNGGPTRTIALLPGSPAIDAGDPQACGAPPVHGVDQRGYARPGQGYNNCSIGAYEFGSVGPPTGCVGDCDADGNCQVNELVLAVNIALGVVDLGECNVLDGNDDGFVTVAELIAGVGNALCGCAGTGGGGAGNGAGDSICAVR
jgi:predicted outer membrane repeat protein